MTGRGSFEEYAEKLVENGFTVIPTSGKAPAVPVYCKLGRRVVYRRDDLVTWLESRVARETSDADARLPRSLTGQQHCAPSR
jgi:hypothetical protein